MWRAWACKCGHPKSGRPGKRRSRPRALLGHCSGVSQGGLARAAGGVMSWCYDVTPGNLFDCDCQKLVPQEVCAPGSRF